MGSYSFLLRSGLSRNTCLDFTVCIILNYNWKVCCFYNTIRGLEDMKYMNLLKKSILFQGIEDCEFDKLLKCLKAKEVKFQKGEMILCYGNVTNSMGMMLQGKAMIVKDDYWGNRFIIKMNY